MRFQDSRLPSLSHTTFLCPQESGLSQWLGNKLTPLQSVSPSTIVLILCIMVAAFTECTSNVATVSLFLPILASIVSELALKTHLPQAALLPTPTQEPCLWVRVT